MHAVPKLIVSALLASLVTVPAVAANAGSLRIVMATRSSSPHIMLPRGMKPNRRGSRNLVYHGGPILKTPIVYVDYWGWTSDPSGEAAYLQSFLSGVGGSQWM